MIDTKKELFSAKFSINIDAYDNLSDCIAKANAMAQVASGEEFSIQPQEIQQYYLITLTDLTLKAYEIIKELDNTTK